MSDDVVDDKQSVTRRVLGGCLGVTRAEACVAARLRLLRSGRELSIFLRFWLWLALLRQFLSSTPLCYAVRMRSFPSCQCHLSYDTSYLLWLQVSFLQLKG